MTAAPASRAEKATIYAAGLVQGIALVTFPAASTIFTSPSSYNLSSTEYGLMFVPQVITAITTSLLGGALTRRFSGKHVYLAGLAANIASMGLLIASRFVMTDHTAAYAVLLAATGCLGAGFGLTVPAVNTFTAAFHPGAVDRSVLVLNALLGLGTALAPIFVAIFVGLGAWVGLPILAVILIAALLIVSTRLPLRTQPAARQLSAPARAPASGHRTRPGVPRQFWAFAAIGVMYGFCETMNGNWSGLDLTSHGVPATTASLTLTLFWSMVTAGRVLFALIQRWFPSRAAYHLLPFLLAGAFLGVAALPSGAPAYGMLMFALTGLGCSALLPLTISFGQEKLTSMADSVAGGVIACYQFGYGIAAFGVGPLRDAGLSLPQIFAVSAAVAAAMGATSFAVAHRRPSPKSLHPRPAGHARQPVTAGSR
jgi:Major Facilitator Superfamily